MKKSPALHPAKTIRNAKYYKRGAGVIHPLDGPLYDREIQGVGGPTRQLTYYKIKDLKTWKEEYDWCLKFKKYSDQLSRMNRAAVRYITGATSKVPYKIKSRARNILRNGLKEVSLAYTANKCLSKSIVKAYAVIETVARYEGPIRKELRGIRQQPSFSVMEIRQIGVKCQSCQSNWARKRRDLRHRKSCKGHP